MSNIGLMEGAFFVGRKEIMEWVNSTLKLNLAKVEDTCNGAVACQFLDIMYPGQVPMHKVNWSAKQEFEHIANYKILQTAFTKLGIEKHVDVDRLITGRYMDNLEFLQWFKAFYERSVTDVGDYDAYAQRIKGKGGATYGGNLKGTSAPTKTASTRAPVKVATTRTVKKTASADEPEKTKENAMPLKQNRQPSQNSSSNVATEKMDVSKYLVEIQNLKKTKDEAHSTMEEMRVEMEGLEKERDFYFEKLRDIEVMLQELEDKGQGNEITASIFKILYATVDGFEAVESTAEEATEVHESQPVEIATEAF